MALKPKIDKRILLKRLADPKSHQPLRVTPEMKAGGDRALAEAKQAYSNRVAESDRNIADYSKEAALYIRNRARGVVMFKGGFGEGRYLGGGRWQYKVGKGWIKLN